MRILATVPRVSRKTSLANGIGLLKHVETGSLFFGCMYTCTCMENVIGHLKYHLKFVGVGRKKNFQWFAWAADVVTIIILSLDC